MTIENEKQYEIAKKQYTELICEMIPPWERLVMEDKKNGIDNKNSVHYIHYEVLFKKSENLRREINDYEGLIKKLKPNKNHI